MASIGGRRKPIHSRQRSLRCRVQANLLQGRQLDGDALHPQKAAVLVRQRCPGAFSNTPQRTPSARSSPQCLLRPAASPRPRHAHNSTAGAAQKVDQSAARKVIQPRGFDCTRSEPMGPPSSPRCEGSPDGLRAAWPPLLGAGPAAGRTPRAMARHCSHFEPSASAFFRTTSRSTQWKDESG